MRKRPVIVIAVVGLGLVLAPFIFQMFSRAPGGGVMIDEFRPFMTAEKLDAFSGYLDEMDRAHAETDGEVQAFLEASGMEVDFDAEFPSLARFNDEWPGIYEDMGGMLETIKGNLDNFEAVDALPPFWMFPWFFVLPGVILWFTSRSTLKSSRYTYPRKRLWFLVVMGAGLIAAPAIFQMFGRAPLGKAMIDDFVPIMTAERVTTMQGYFITLAGGEGAIRTRVAPMVEETADFSDEFPDSAAFVDDWPQISSEMAPMVGAMADNLDNFAGVNALPPFTLFPWFFVIPGVIVAGSALVAMRRPLPVEKKG